jgi:hypothetical protein
MYPRRLVTVTSYNHSVTDVSPSKPRSQPWVLTPEQAVRQALTDDVDVRLACYDYLTEPRLQLRTTI